MASGSAQTRNSAADAAETIAIKSANILRKREHIEHAPFGRVLRQLLCGVGETESSARVARIQSPGHHGSGPPADSGKHRDVLLSVRALIGDWLADDPGAGLEFPKLLAGNRVYRLEPAIHGAEKDDVSRGHDCTAPDREFVLEHPDGFFVEDVPRRELAHVAAGSRIHAGVLADI